MLNLEKIKACFIQLNKTLFLLYKRKTYQTMISKFFELNLDSGLKF